MRVRLDWICSKKWTETNSNFWFETVATNLGTGEIVWIAGGIARSHDKKIFDECGLRELLIDEGEMRLADKGYVGAEQLYTPFKGNDLTPQQELWNNCLSSVRILVERMNGRIKNFAAMQFWRGRNPLDGRHQAVFHVICNLVNISIQTNPLVFEVNDLLLGEVPE